MDPFWRYHDDPLYFDLVNTLCSLIREGVTAQELRNAVSIAEEKLREEHERHGHKAEVERLRAENERLREANHSVRVCRDHTSEIVGYGCLVCEIERLRRVQDEEIMAGRESLAQEIRHLLRARQYWGGTTEISSVINAVGAALDHVDALENRVAELAPNQEAKSE